MRTVSPAIVTVFALSKDVLSFAPSSSGRSTITRALHSTVEAAGVSEELFFASVIEEPICVAAEMSEVCSQVPSLPIVPQQMPTAGAAAPRFEKPAAIPSLPIMSQSMPFLTRPAALTGELAGDVGFDPLGFANTPKDLMTYREAEIKHARLAMLAAAGWPVSELLDPKLAALFHRAPLVDAADRAPSLLNGGLDQVSPLYWAAVLGLAAAVELVSLTKLLRMGGNSRYTPGDYQFDPLGLYPDGAEGRKRMQLAEIKHGRLSMLAVTAFAVQEAVSEVAVVDETPFFFRPVFQWGEYMHADAGYIVH